MPRTKRRSLSPQGGGGVEVGLDLPCWWSGRCFSNSWRWPGPLWRWAGEFGRPLYRSFEAFWRFWWGSDRFCHMIFTGNYVFSIKIPGKKLPSQKIVVGKILGSEYSRMTILRPDNLVNTIFCYFIQLLFKESALHGHWYHARYIVCCRT